MSDSELPRPINSESIDEKERYRKLYESMATHTNSDRQKNISYGVNKQSNLTTKLIIRDRDKDPKELERISEKPTQTLEKQLSDSDSDSNEKEMLRRSNADATKNARLTQLDNGVMLYDHFIINSVRYNAQQKFQVVDTFDDSFLYSFGEKPVTAQFSGVLFNVLNQQEGKRSNIDKNNSNWRSSWMFTYDKLLNSTDSIAANTDVYINFEDILWKGRVLNTSWQLGSNPAPESVNFSFTFYIEDKRNDIISHKPPHETHDNYHNLGLENTITELAKSESSAEDIKERVQNSISRPDAETVQSKLDKALENNEEDNPGEPDLIEALNDSMETDDCGDVPQEIYELNQEIAGDPTRSGGPVETIRNWVYRPLSNKSAENGLREKITRNIAGDTITFRNEFSSGNKSPASNFNRSPASIAGPANTLRFTGAVVNNTLKHIHKAISEDDLGTGSNWFDGVSITFEAPGEDDGYYKEFIAGQSKLYDAEKVGNNTYTMAEDKFNDLPEKPSGIRLINLKESSNVKRLKDMIGSVMLGEPGVYQSVGGEIPNMKIKQAIKQSNFELDFSFAQFLAFIWQSGDNNLYKSKEEVESARGSQFTNGKVYTDNVEKHSIGELKDIIGNTAEVLENIGYSNFSDFKTEIMNAAKANNIAAVSESSGSFNPIFYERFRFFNPLPNEITIENINTISGSDTTINVSNEGLVTNFGDKKIEELLTHPQTNIDVSGDISSSVGEVSINFEGIELGGETINFHSATGLHIPVGLSEPPASSDNIKERIKEYRRRHNKFTYNGTSEDDNGQCATKEDADVEDGTINMQEFTPDGERNPFEENIASGDEQDNTSDTDTGEQYRPRDVGYQY